MVVTARGSQWHPLLVDLLWILCGYPGFHRGTFSRGDMKVEVKRGDKFIPLSSRETTAIVLLFALSIILALYAGGAIGWCYCGFVEHIIDNAEKHAEKHVECEECEESKRNFIPVEIPDRESKEDE